MMATVGERSQAVSRDWRQARNRNSSQKPATSDSHAHDPSTQMVVAARPSCSAPSCFSAGETSASSANISAHNPIAAGQKPRRFTPLSNIP